MPKPITRITRTFVRPGGAITGVLKIDLTDPAVVAAQLARDRAETNDWNNLIGSDATAAARHLADMIRECAPRVRDMLQAFHQHGRSQFAFEHLAGCTFEKRSRSAFQRLWTESALHIRREVSNDDILLNALWRLLPSYEGAPMRLYRGEPWEDFVTKRHGFSWSSELGVATTYARGLNALYEDGGVLIETHAPANAIISRSPTEGVNGWEFEHIVDPRRLTQIKLLERFPDARSR